MSSSKKDIPVTRPTNPPLAPAGTEGAPSIFHNLSNDATNELAPPHYRPSYFHYTSAAGVMGIVEENCLRFSDTKFVNDISERAWAFRMYREVVDEIKPLLNPNESEFVESMYRLEDSFRESFRPVIFCMSADGNLLNQWRDYGKDMVSYSIELSSSYFSSTPNGAGFIPSVTDLIYDEKLQKKLVRRVLDGVITRMKAAWAHHKPSEIEELAITASFQVGHLLDRFKNSAFTAEQETRLSDSFYAVSQGVAPKFRASALGVVPYYEYRPETALPIKSIMVGPSPHSAASAEALKMFLDKHKLSHVEVRLSEIPIRRS